MRKILFYAFLIFSSSQLSASKSETLKEAEASPLTINSRNGLHCEREKQFCRAEGQVVVRKGPYELFAEKAKAFIRKNAAGKTEIRYVEVEGDVRFFGPQGESGKSDQATYNIDKKRIQLIPLAGKQVTIWKDQYILRADRIDIYFEENKAAKASLRQIDAVGHVLLSSTEEIIEGDKAVFTPHNHLIIVTGDVRVTNASGQLRGNYAKVNVDTKQSEVLKKSSVIEDNRAQVFIYPKEVQKGSLGKRLKPNQTKL